MRRCVTVLVAVALAASLAGCMGGEEPPAASDDGSQAEEEANATLAAPTWEIGDWWTWDTGQQGEVTLVVTGEDGGDWIVGTTNEAVAFFHARFPVSYLGEVRKADLAGSQPDTRVAFFDWPLEAGKTWTTTWDGVERTITVDRVEDGTAHLTATQDGRPAVTYTYDAERGSFGELVFLDANGTETFAMEPQASGSSFEQPAVRWQLAQALDEAGTIGAEPESFGFGFEVPEEATDLWLDLQLACPGTGTYHVSFGPSGDAQTTESSSYENRDVCPAEANVTSVVVEEPAPGSYRGGFTATSPQAEGAYGITLYVRTLLEVPVGEG